MLQTVLDSGFKGPFVVLGHVDDADVEESLRGTPGAGVRPRWLFDGDARLVADRH